MNFSGWVLVTPDIYDAVREHPKQSFDSTFKLKMMKQSVVLSVALTLFFGYVVISIVKSSGNFTKVI